jgi:hypothetical protein
MNMVSRFDTPPPALPFGRHRGQPLSAVPSSYLAWLLREVKLSSGLRAAVAAELAGRGIGVPPPPPFVPAACRRCGPAGHSFRWAQDRRGGRRVRVQCGRCHAYLGFAPCRPPFTTKADENSSPTAALDVLVQAGACGVRIVSDGQKADIDPRDWRQAPPELRSRIRECAHLLAGLLGRREAV